MKHDNGSISVEACVTVTLFMLLMFMFLGFFQMFMAQNAVAHATLQTAESLAMDAWQVSKLQMNGLPDDVGNFFANLAAESFGSEEDNPYFVTESEWYDSSTLLDKAVGNRFLGYFYGGDGAAAAQYIKAVNIEKSGSDWADSFDFSESKIVNGDLHVTVKYKLNYMLQIWGLENGVDIKQTAVSHLWMPGAESKNLS